MAIAELDVSTIVARPGSRITNKQAQAIAPALFELEQSKNLKPEAVVDLARNPESPLHDLFEWDDEKAAHQQRLATARMVIRAVSFRVQSIGKDVNNFTAAFVSVNESDVNEETGDVEPEERRYASVSRVLSDGNLQRQVLAGIQRDVEALVRKLETLKALGNASAKARELLEELKRAS